MIRKVSIEYVTVSTKFVGSDAEKENKRDDLCEHVLLIFRLIGITGALCLHDTSEPSGIG